MRVREIGNSGSGWTRRSECGLVARGKGSTGNERVERSCNLEKNVPRSRGALLFVRSDPPTWPLLPRLLRIAMGLTRIRIIFGVTGKIQLTLIITFNSVKNIKFLLF